MSEPESKDPYYQTPVTKETFQKFVNLIKNNLSINRSITFNFYPQIGGATSWINAILNEQAEINITNFLRENNFIYYRLNPKMLISNDPEEFVTYLYTVIFNKSPKSNSSYYIKLLEIKDEMKNKINSKKNILFVTNKFNKFNFHKKEQYEILYTLYQIDKSKINFLTTIETNTADNFLNNIGHLKEPLTMAFYEYKRFSEKDIKYSIKHWQEIFRTDYTKREIDIIIELSQGSLYYTKILCNMLSQNRKLAGNKTQLKKELDEILIKNKKTLELKDNKLIINNIDIRQYISDIDYQILEILYKNASTTISRDQIAEIIWGKDYYDYYSDYAIDKHISDIRKFIEDNNIAVKIKTIRGIGYMLIKN